MRRGAVVLVAVVTACGVELPLRDDVVYTCTKTVDCPLELTCAPLARRCVADLDVTPPRLTSISATSRDTLVMVFDETVDAAVASLPSSYRVTRADGVPLSVEAVALLPDGKSASFRTGVQRGGAVYTVATLVTDLQANPAVLEVATFVGFGPAPDTEPPEVTSPAAASVIVVPESERQAPEVTLSWTPRAGAIAYTIEIARTGNFASVETRLSVDGDASSYALAVTEGTTYFWRVRSDATREGEYGVSSFTVLFDTLYVSCPSSRATCLSGFGVGSKNDPLASVSRAVSLAADRNIPNIAIAARGGSAGYHEPIGVTGGALTLRGGYNAEFTGTVDPTTDPTLVDYEVSVLTVVQNTGRLELDGLTLRAVPEPLAPTQPLSTVVLDGIGADVVFTHVAVETVDLDGSTGAQDSLPFDTFGIVARNSAGGALVLGRGTRVLAGEAFHGAAAVQLSQTRLVVDQATLVARRRYSTTFDSFSTALQGSDAELAVERLDATSSTPFAGARSAALELVRVSGFVRDSRISVQGHETTGLKLSNGELAIEGNQIIATGTSRAAGISVAGQTTLVANNTVIVDSPVAAGVEAVLGDRRIVNNTLVVAGGAVTAAGIEVAAGVVSGSPLDIANNLVFCLVGAGTRYGVLETCVTCDPSSVIANVVSGCDGAYFDENASIVSDLDTLAGQTIGCAGGCGTTRASGNATVAVADPFVSLFGVDGMLATADNDLRLATVEPALVAGGVDTTTTACGTSEAPRHCGNVTTDLAGQLRSPPVSVGAYEKD